MVVVFVLVVYCSSHFTKLVLKYGIFLIYLLVEVIDNLFFSSSFTKSNYLSSDFGFTLFTLFLMDIYFSSSITRILFYYFELVGLLLAL